MAGAIALSSICITVSSFVSTLFVIQIYKLIKKNI